MAEAARVALVRPSLLRLFEARLRGPPHRIEDLDDRRATWCEPLLGDPAQETPLVRVLAHAEAVPVAHDIEIASHVSAVEIASNEPGIVDNAAAVANWMRSLKSIAVTSSPTAAHARAVDP